MKWHDYTWSEICPIQLGEWIYITILWHKTWLYYFMTQTILHFEKNGMYVHKFTYSIHTWQLIQYLLSHSFFLEWTDIHLQKDTEREASQKSNVPVMDHPTSRPRTPYLPLLAFAIPLLDEFWRKYKSIYFLRGRSTRYLWTQHTHIQYQVEQLCRHDVNKQWHIILYSCLSKANIRILIIKVGLCKAQRSIIVLWKLGHT